MIKLSKMSDHALALCAALSREPLATRAAGEWARQSGLNEATATKILKLLRAAGICESRRGKSGGYKMARQPECVSFLAVIEAVDGPVAFADCAPGGKGCVSEPSCAVRPHAAKLGGGMRDLLAAQTLASLTRPQGGHHGQ